ELYFEVAPNKEIKESEVPIQVQVSYTDEAGARRVRSLTTKLKVSKNEDEIMATMDPTVGATFITQKAGEESFGGDREKGRKRIASFRSAMKSKAGAAPKAVQAMLEKADMALDMEDKEIERQEEMMEAAPASAPSGAADEAFTENLAQMKRSSKSLFRKDVDEE
ncbi:MAG: hypothetical protein IH631_01480, partial [Candidatus Thorarchaeota archaeon]|nr:hypothetical protein [Candidatus Thorarchaeota archaeon]